MNMPQASIIDQIADQRDELLKKNKQLKYRIKRLEKTGDDLINWITTDLFCNPKLQRLENQWRKAKDSKP